MKKRNHKRIYCLVIVCGICLLAYDMHKRESIEQQNKKQITSFLEQPIQEEIESTQEESVVKEPYIAILEIPNIGLKRGFFPLTSKRNNVKYAVQMIEPSTMPNIEKGNLILASHNGTSPISFFSNLWKLEPGDEIYIYDNHFQYIYQLDHVYDVEKTGKIEIMRDNNQTTITLITCKRGSKTKQEVYIGYLKDKQTYH